MRDFRFQGVDLDGVRVEGVITTESDSQLRNWLSRLGIGQAQFGEAGFSGSDLFGGISVLNDHEAALYLRHTAICFHSGLPLNLSLEVAGQHSNPRVEAVACMLVTSVENGRRLSTSMAAFGQCFSLATLSMIRIGEETGGLALALESAAELLEKQLTLRRRITSALIYPGITLALFSLIAGVMAFVLMPTFTQVYASLEVDPPWAMRLLGAIGLYFNRGIGFFLMAQALLLLWLGGRRWSTEPGVREAVWSWGMKVPVLKDLLVELMVADFVLMLRRLLHCGVNLLAALKVCSGAASLPLMKQKIDRILEGVTQGQTLTEAAQQSGWLPPLVVGMLAVGEQTGALVKVLGSLQQTLEDSVEHKTQTFLLLLEPALLVFMGLFSGALVMLLMSPMLTLLSRL